MQEKNTQEETKKVEVKLSVADGIKFGFGFVIGASLLGIILTIISVIFGAGIIGSLFFF